MLFHDNAFEGVFYYTITKVAYRSNYLWLFCDIPICFVSDVVSLYRNVINAAVILLFYRFSIKGYVAVFIRAFYLVTGYGAG